MREGVFCLVVLVIVAVTAFAGRWYCSVLCPFGTMQEAVWRVARLVAGWKTRFISPWRLRYVVPIFAGIGTVTAPALFLLTDPISNFGRGVRGVYIILTGGIDSMAPIIWVMIGIFAFVLVLAVARGRRFCDWCPVGVMLGAFTLAAPLGMRLRKEACVSCGRCERACPMNCIDSKGMTLEEARCVLCLGCAGTCAVGAVGYGSVLPGERAGRREFLRKGGGVLASLAGVIYLGGFMARAFPGLRKRGNISGLIPVIMPPGARDANWYLSKCVGCQICAAACPAKIIRIGGSPHPELDYTDGYCQYNCTECARVCPTGALRLEDGMKQRTRIALSALNRTRCVVIRNGEACGACAEVCPTRAVRMVPIEAGSLLTAPVFDEQYCIGCGGCFHACPAEPNAFKVTGVTPQILTPGIRPTDAEEDDESHVIPFSGDEFPF